MPRNAPLTATDRQQIVGLYLAGTKIQEIARMTERSKQTLYSALRRAGVEHRNSPMGARGPLARSAVSQFMPLDLKALVQDRLRIPARLLGPEEKACRRRISLCG